MRKTVVAGVGALALALGTAAPAVADGQDQTPDYGVTTTTIELAECGSATITWTNPTEWTFWGDWRKGDDPDAGEADEVDPEALIAEGPLKGKKFGKVYNKIELAPGTTDDTREITVDPGEGSVQLRAWVKRGPEQRSFSAEEVEIPRCAPAETTTPPPADDGDTTPPTSGDETTPPAEEPSDDTKTGDDDAKDSDDGQDNDGADEADEDGTAPTPEPQEAHIAVTG